MRKRVIPENKKDESAMAGNWLELETAAEVAVTSEDPAFPLESALGISAGPGWRASSTGAQTIRLTFDHPLTVRRIHLEFREEKCERTQEFLLRWSSDNGETWCEIVRQQYNFNAAATREVEDYPVQLDCATGIELQIMPNMSREGAVASLHRLQVA